MKDEFYAQSLSAGRTSLTMCLTRMEYLTDISKHILSECAIHGVNESTLRKLNEISREFDDWNLRATVQLQKNQIVEQLRKIEKEEEAAK